MYFEIMFFVLGIVALAQRFYYQRRIQLMRDEHARQLKNVRSWGRSEALNDPGLVIAASRKLYKATARHN